MATDPADMHSRDLSTGEQDGPGLTAFETPAARVPPGGGMAEAQRTRPQYSPVAQPGMVSEIHWHTVESVQRAGGQPDPHHEQATHGMIGRLNRRHPAETRGGGHRGGRRGGRRGRR